MAATRPVQMDERRRLQYVARFYPHLQGLRLIPMGVLFWVMAAWSAGFFRRVPGISRGHGPENWFAMLFGLALATAMLFGIYYRRRFGVVRAAHRVRGPLTLLGFVLAFSLAVWFQDALHTTVSLPLIVIAIAVWYGGVLGGLLRQHYLVVSVGLLVVAMLGTFGVSVYMREVVCDAVAGLGLMVVGVGDHLLILRTLTWVSHVESV